MCGVSIFGRACNGTDDNGGEALPVYITEAAAVDEETEDGLPVDTTEAAAVDEETEDGSFDNDLQALLECDAGDFVTEDGLELFGEDAIDEC